MKKTKWISVARNEPVSKPICSIVFLIHYCLHQQWAPKIFPGLVKFHIVHHCKNPDRCFCFSLTFWDNLFNTAPPDELTISPRIIDYYFEKKPNNEVAINEIINEKFFGP